ncbi:TetR/AcrR family transcriptional regulator [bacterium]|nr:TetR/AcrR family transcriptional regulator [bacterium]
MALRTPQNEAGRSSGDQAKADPERSKRRQIFTAAEPLFVRFGFKKTTIEEVCRAAKMSKRTFYELFNDKLDLLVQMHSALAQDLTDEVLATLPEGASATGKVRHYLSTYFNVVQAHPLFQVLLEDAELMRTMTHIAPTNTELYSVINLLSSFLQEGVERGEFRQLDPEMATWIIQTLLDTVHIFLMNPDAVAIQMDVDTLIHETTEFIIHGLLPYPNESSRGMNI